MCMYLSESQCTVRLQAMQLHHHPGCLHQLAYWLADRPQDTQATRQAAATKALSPEAQAALAAERAPITPGLPSLKVEVGTLHPQYLLMQACNMT